MFKRKGVRKFLSITIDPQNHTVIVKNGKERTVASYRLSYAVDQMECFVLIDAIRPSVMALYASYIFQSAATSAIAKPPDIHF